MKKLTLSQSMFYGRFIFGLAYLIGFVASFFADSLAFTILEIIMMILAIIGIVATAKSRTEDYDEMGTLNLHKANTFTISSLKFMQLEA